MFFLKSFRKKISSRSKPAVKRAKKDYQKADNLLLALEPRYLYDAAGVVSGLDIANDHDAPDPAIAQHPIIEAHPVFELDDISVPPDFAAPENTPQELVFVDKSVSNYQQLIENISPDAVTIIIDSNDDGIVRMSNELSNYTNIQAIHILSHGTEGQVNIGNAALNANTLGQYSQLFKEWDNALTRDADILIYGCNVAADDGGVDFISNLSDLTNADVAASSDDTGNRELGGDWDLEAKTGNIEEHNALQSDITAYDGLLAAPVLGGGSATLSYTEDSGPQNIDTTVTVTDSDSNVQSATVTITGNYVIGEDVLQFTNTGSITGTWDALNGTMTLNGSDSAANYQAALRSVQYENLNDNPNVANRFIRFIASDGTNSNAVFSQISITPVNDLPTINAGAVLNFTEGDVATVLDNTITVADADHTNLASAKIIISGNYQAEDVLNFVDQSGITGTWNGAGTLDLVGSATLAQYQTALRSITYSNTGGNTPVGGLRTLSWTVNDGSGNSIAATSSVAVTAIDDAPSASNMNATQTVNEDITLDLTNIVISDVDSANVTATLTLSDPGAGAFSTATSGAVTSTYNAISGAWQASGNLTDVNTLLAGVQFVPTADHDSSFTIATQVTDGTSTITDSKTITITAINDAPTISSGATLNFTENDAPSAIDAAVSIADVDDATLQGATVVISGGFQAEDSLSFSTQNGISGVWAGNTLTLSGVATVADYQAALRSIAYVNSAGDNPISGNRTLTWTITDTTGPASSAPASSTITVTPVNDAPTATNLTSTAAYTEGDASVPITDIVISDADTGDIVTATLTLANISAGTLSAASGNGETYTAGTGVWTVSGTTAVVNTALANMAFVPAADNDLDTSISVNIADGGENGATSLTGTITLDVTPVNDAPTSANNTINTSEDTAYAFVSGDFSFTDVDTGDTLTNVKITALPAAGSLKLSGVNVTTNQLITIADITAGNLTFTPAANANGAGYSNFTFQVEDGSLLSGNNTITINVNAVNDAPTLTAGNALTYSEGDSAQTIDNSITVTDVDAGATITGATVTITTGFAAGQDVLGFTNAFGVSLVSYNSLTGVLTLTGTTTMANYESALRTVTYENTNTNNPIAGSRTISWQATDNNAATSTAVTSSITVNAINDLPVLAAPSGNLAYSENAIAAAIDSAITINDVDDINIENATITISGNPDINDLLFYDNSSTPNIGVSYNAVSGILTLSGTDTTANYQSALRNVTFSNSSDNPSTLQRTISWMVNDGDGNSNIATSLIDVTAVNDLPTATDNNIAITEDSTYTLTASDFGFSDADSGDTLTQVRITQLESAGALQLSGTDVTQNQIITLANINAGNLKYSPTTDGFGVSYDTFRFEVYDGTAFSATDYAITFDVSNIQDLPTAANNAISINEDTVLTFSTNNFNFTDVDGDLLNKVQITTLPVAGILELNGVAVSSAQEISSTDISSNLLTFTPTANASGAAYASFTFKVHDGTAFSAAAYTMTINVNAINDAPVITINGTPQTFSEGGPSVTVDSAVTLSDIESDQINSATIRISTGFAAGQDNLSFTPVGAITGSFNALSGTLTLSGTDSIANYQTALQSVTYNNTNLTNPLSGARTIEFIVNDGDASNTGNITVNVNAVNDAPVLSAGGTLSYTENSAAANIDNLITITDVDDINITGGTVSIAPGDYENGKDVLAFAGLGNISGSWDSATGTLTLTGTDTVSNYQNALRIITYQNLSDNPASGSRQINWIVSDGSNNSTTVSSTVNVTVVNDAPTISNLTTSVSYLENTIQATPAILDNVVSFTDADSVDLSSGILTISNLHANDVISVNNQSAVDGNIQLSGSNVQYHTGGGWQTIGTLTGGSGGTNLTITFTTSFATPTAVDALIQNITYQNTSNNPPASHDLNLSVSDGDGGTSTTQTIQVNITAQNENPTISGLDNPTFLENTINTTPAIIDPAVVFSDPDSTDLNGGQLTITNLDANDTLSVNSQAAVDGNIQLSGSSVQYHTGGGWQTIGTLTGGNAGTDLIINFSSLATPAAVDALIQNINFLNDSDTPPASHNLSLSITDGDGGSLSGQTITINITPENDAPAVDLNGPSAGIDFATNYNEGTPVKVFDVSATVIDPDTVNLSSITVTLTNRPDGDGIESLSADVTGTSLTAIYTQGTGVLLISGTDTVANYQLVLRKVIYDNTSNTPDLTNRSITVVANDGTDSSLLATSTLSITAANDPPTATNNTVTTNEDTPYNFVAADFSYTDADADPLAKVQITTLESNGALEFFNGSSWLAVTTNQEITKADIDAGNFRFTPAANANGASYATFSFKVNDGIVYSVAAYTMTVDVTAINDLPTAANSSILGNEDSSVVLNAADFSFNDVDGDIMSSVKITTLETVGALQYDSGSWVDVTLNQVISKADIDAGKLRFTPAVNSAGSPYDTFDFTVNDGTADSSAAYTMTVDINSIGDTPQVTNVTTLEDTQSGNIVVSRNIADGPEVTHFRISNISGGTLYQNDGSTIINDGDYITFAQGNTGLKFTPASNSNASGSFDVESSENGSTVAAQSGVATSTITVTPVGDSPQISNITTPEDTQSGTIVLDKNALDGAEISHLRISNISGGTLYQNDGSTVINDGDYITLAQGNAGLRFTPTANSNTNGTFDVESSENGSTVAAQSAAITSTITITPVGDTPQVTNITTLEDNQSGDIFISRNTADGAEVTHFKISNIVGGTLFQNDGSTVISNGSYITAAQGTAGLKFTPTANSNTNGSFDVESSQNGTTVAAQSGVATSTISITPVGDTPVAANITTLEDTQSAGITITPNAADGAEVTHFKISGISNGTLFQNNGTTSISDGDYITLAEGAAGLKFTPAANSVSPGSFNIQSSEDGSTVAAQSGVATSTITVTPVGDTPQITNVTTAEDTQSGDIFVTPNSLDGAEVTHFRISNISGGLVFQNDGTTQINAGDYITAAQGAAGLKFTPNTNSTTNGSFDVEASENGTSVAAQSGAATTTITITPVGDTPVVNNITTLEDNQSGGIVLARNAADGVEVSHFQISNITNGTLYLNDGTTPVNNGDVITYAQGNTGLKFTPAANTNLSGTFDVKSATSAGGGGLSSAATSTITVTPVGDTPVASNITTLEDNQSGDIFVTPNAADGAEVTHFRISNIGNGTLYKNDGTTVINNGTYITLAEGALGLKFTPNANSTANGTFDVESSEDGTSVAAQSGIATSTVTVTPVGDTPQVNNITTLEDTQSGAIVLARNPSDGNEVTHFRISAITNGTLYQNDGTTIINNGDYITFAQGSAGLKFTPTSNSTANGSFNVESSENGTTVAAQSSSATSTITVTPVGDTPQVSNVTTLEDNQSGNITITPNASDGPEVTNFRISNIIAGTLYQNDGTTLINSGDYITLAEGAAGLKFTPATNSNANGSFDVQSSEDGTTVAAQSGIATSTISVTPVGDTPQVSNITTLEDTQSGTISISPNAADGPEVSHFRISNITNGTLYQNDGTTLVNNGDYITTAQGTAGLKFTPTTNSTANGTFDVEASEDGSTVAAQSGIATSTITVTSVGDIPIVNNITTTEDTQSAAITLDRNAADGPEVSHFQISNILNGTVYLNDGTTQVNNGDIITYAQGNTGLKFTPSTNSNVNGTFEVRSATSAAGAGLSSGSATSTITITPVGDTPQVTSISTLEDIQSGNIIISPNAFDGAEVTNFRISNINGGSLYQNDGTTAINNGDYITLAEGTAGLKFTPTTDSNTNGTFDVEASEDGTTVAAQSAAATSTITIIPVNDAPTATNMSAAESFSEDATSFVFNAISITDIDSANVTATLTLSDPAAGTLSPGTSGSVTSTFIGGVWTASGTLADVNILLSGLTFTPASNYDQNFTIATSVDDGVAPAITGSKSITVTPVQDVPTSADNAANSVQNLPYVFLSTDFPFADVDSSGANTLTQIQITSLPLASAGVLTLSGTAVNINDTVTLAQITSNSLVFTPVTDFIGSPTFNFRVYDGLGYSTPVNTMTVNITNANAPVLTAGGTLNYTENDPASSIDTTIFIADNSDEITQATVTISAGFNVGEDVLAFSDTAQITGSWNGAAGILTLSSVSGTATLAEYQNALRSVTYENLLDNPTAGNRTISWAATDNDVAGPYPSIPVTSTVAVSAVNDAPIITAGNTLNYSENDAATTIDPTIGISDLDSPTISGATIKVSSGYINGQDVLGFTDTGTITGTWNAATATMTLSGVDTTVNYRNALRSVTYVNSEGANPFAGNRTITYQVNDGSDNSLAVNSIVAVSAVNDAPTITAGATVNYTEGDPASVIDGTITVADVDSSIIQSAKVRITGGYTIAEDTLAFTNTVNITGSWDGAGTLTLSGSDTITAYRDALRNVTYQNTNGLNPIAGNRTISFEVNDGVNSSIAALSTVTVTSVNDLPVIASSGTPTTFTEGDSAIIVDSSLTLSDNDNSTFAGATISISAGYVNGEDVLAFSNTASITGTWTAATGTLSLTGTDTIAAYEAALRSITFDNTIAPPLNPTTGNRSISFVVNDGIDNSLATSTTVTVTAVDDPPTATNMSTGESFTEDAAAFSLNNIVVTDVDSTNITATLTLSDTNAGALSSNNGAVYNAGTGIWIITDTVANVNTALANVQLTPAADYDQNFSITTQINDASSSIYGSKAATVIAQNDAPTLVANTGITVNEGGTTVITQARLDYTDVDTGDILTYTIGTTPTNGTLLRNGIALNATDTFTQADINSGLITYTHNSSETIADSFIFDLDDSTAPSPDFNNVTFNITVTPVNDAPASANGSVTTNEDTAFTFAQADFTYNDAEADTFTKIKISKLQSHGTLKLSGVDVTLNQEILVGNLTNLVFTPAADAYGTGYDSFRFMVHDGTEFSSIDYAMNIDVTPVNDSPVLDTTASHALSVIQRNTINAVGDTVADIIINGSISDIDVSTFEAMAVTSVDNTNGLWQYSTDDGITWNNFSGTTGTIVDLEGATASRLLQATDKIRFEPNSSWDGNAAFSFRAWDMSAGSGTAGSTTDTTTNGGTTGYSSVIDSATIKINASPIANSDTATTGQNQPVVLPLLTNDTDNTSDQLTISSFTTPAHGKIVDNGNGTLTYTPNFTYFGPDSFSYTISDGFGGTSSSTVSIEVIESIGPQAMPAVTNTQPVPEVEYEPLEMLDGLVETQDSMLLDINGKIEAGMSDGAEYIGSTLERQNFEEFVRPAAIDDVEQFARKFGGNPQNDIIRHQAVNQAQPIAQPSDAASIKIGKLADKTDLLKPPTLSTDGDFNEPAQEQPPLPVEEIETLEENIEVEEKAEEVRQEAPLPQSSSTTQGKEKQIPTQNLKTDQQSNQQAQTDERSKNTTLQSAEQAAIRETMNEAFELLQCD